jgi:transposase
MNNNSIIESHASSVSYVARIGFDWGDKEHAFQLLEAENDHLEKRKIGHSAESLHAWLQNLDERFGGRPVALGVEANRGALLHVFEQYPWLDIYPVNPATSARYRKAFTVSGAKDDLPDSGVILEILRLHPDKLTLWQKEDEPTRRLDALTRARRDAVDRRTQCLNQLTSLLKTFYPQGLELAGGDLSAPMALEFLLRWPDLIALKSARPSTVRAFYYKHNVRRPEVVEQRLEQIKNAVALTTDDVVVSTAQMQLALLLDQIKAFNKHITAFEEKIKASFKDHPEAALFGNLPGAGRALAPRLLVAFGTDRSRYPSPGNMQKFVGVAPVREKSGRQLWTHWRWQAPKFLRQTFVEWAGQTVIWSSWAKHYYQRMNTRGKKHHVILRALAFKWIRILWKCWQTRVPYDETTYLKALAKRRSPNLPPIETE